MGKTIYVVSVCGFHVHNGETDYPNGGYTYLSDEYGEIMFNLFSEAEAIYKSKKKDDQFLGLIFEDPNYLYGYETVETVSLKWLDFDENGEMEGGDMIARYTRILDHQTT